MKYVEARRKKRGAQTFLDKSSRYEVTCSIRQQQREVSLDKNGKDLMPNRAWRDYSPMQPCYKIEQVKFNDPKADLIMLLSFEVRL